MHHLAKFAKLLAGMGRCAAPSRPALDCCAECCTPLAPRCLQDACNASRNAWISMKIANCRAPIAACMASAVACRALTTTGRLQPPAGRLQLPAGRLQLSAERLLHRARTCHNPCPASSRQDAYSRRASAGTCWASAVACRATCRVPTWRLQLPAGLPAGCLQGACKQL